MTKQNNIATQVVSVANDLLLDMPDGIVGWAFPGIHRVTHEQVTETDLQKDMMWLECEEGQTLGEYFDILIQTNRIRRCLNVNEGRILIKNNALSSPFFAHKQVLLWRSVGYDRAGNSFVPIIQNIQGQQPIIYLHRLESYLSRRHATYTFHGYV